MVNSSILSPNDLKTSMFARRWTILRLLEPRKAKAGFRWSKCGDFFTVCSLPGSKSTTSWITAEDLVSVDVLLVRDSQSWVFSSLDESLISRVNVMHLKLYTSQVGFLWLIITKAMAFKRNNVLLVIDNSISMPVLRNWHEKFKYLLN